MFSRECGWCDPFGDIFMQYLANKDLRGQCFTPDGVANLCARILDTFVGIKQVINDPACGSGRMLLAAAKLAEKRGEHIYVIGEDIDSVCVKQTAINLALHGIYGEVVCHDTLKDPDGIRFGYIVNELIYPDRLGRPSLRFSKDAGDFVCTKFWRCKRRAEPVQLTLF
jgi:type I restriction enzyme M protein